ncbi:MAG: DUF1614 domain-containing protein [Methylococcales bacterium]|nr:DUF1614 domain-containing protein [Methylococcales bacterium]MDD5632746.1 DUF1614 domain-containing protein [Methylococcales bacterium]
MPVNSLLLFFLIALFFAAMLQVHFFEIAFVKLGLTPEAASILLLGTLVGSTINLPVYSLKIKKSGHLVMSPGRKMIWEIFQPERKGRVVIAVNVGGCLIPVGLCLYFIFLQELDPFKIIVSTLAITALSYKFSRLIPGLGVGMPIFVAPLASALLALALDPEHAAPLAYISGVFGVLIGADILRLNEIASLDTPVAAIGGAGTFDGIFMTGIIAALLA